MADTVANQVIASDTSDVSDLEDMSHTSGGIGSNSDEMRFSFVDFPPHIRNTIYHLVLVAGPEPVTYVPLYSREDRRSGAAKPIPGVLPEQIRYYCDDSRKSFVVSHDPAAVTTLAQPGLTRTNKQIRAESLPIYYGENHFQITIRPQGFGQPTDGWSRFVGMMHVFSAGGPGGYGTSWLRFIQRISVECTKTIKDLSDEGYHGPDEIDFTFKHRFELGFKSVVVPARRNPATRIGDDNLNWNDALAVKRAFREAALQKWVSHTRWGLLEDVPFELVADALYMIALECPRATEWMKVTCLCPFDAICWKDWKY